MSSPHVQLLKKQAERIRSLTNEEIATFEPWQVLQWAMSYGVPGRVADWLNTHENTVRSRMHEPATNQSPESLGRGADPYGRNGELANFFGYFLTVTGCSPEGGRLILRWLTIKYAEKMAEQGHPELLTALDVIDEVAEHAQRILELTGNATGSK